MIFDMFKRETKLISDNMGELFFIAWARAMRPSFNIIESVPDTEETENLCGVGCPLCKRFACFPPGTEESDTFEEIEGEGWTRECSNCDEFIFHVHCCPKCHPLRLCPDCTKEVTERETE